MGNVKDSLLLAVRRRQAERLINDLKCDPQLREFLLDNLDLLIIYSKELADISQRIAYLTGEPAPKKAFFRKEGDDDSEKRREEFLRHQDALRIQAIRKDYARLSRSWNDLLALNGDLQRLLAAGYPPDSAEVRAKRQRLTPIWSQYKDTQKRYLGEDRPLHDPQLEAERLRLVESIRKPLVIAAELDALTLEGGSPNADGQDL